jgi:hypothetical protein
MTMSDEEKKEEPFRLAVEVSEEMVRDLLISALEGGSNYWVCIEDANGASAARYLSDVPLTADGFLIITAPSNRQGLREVRFDEKNHDMLPAFLDRKAIVRGLEVMHRDHGAHYGEMISGGGDATTGDVFLQCCLYGDVIFG